MRIGQFVKSHIKDIFQHCDTADHEEFIRLMDDNYSKKTFDINFPFCKEASKIPADQSMRYWKSNYIVRGKTVRVSSQWYDLNTSKSRNLFTQYLLTKKIVTEEGLSSSAISISPTSETLTNRTTRTRQNSRYKGNAIGNAQNFVIRNILSNLGKESFNERDWTESKEYFSNSCAYCGKEDDLVMEHAVPINRQSLGEHRLGNLVPSCRLCNSSKADKNFRDFLSNDPLRVKKIEEHMDSHNYFPLSDNDQINAILEIAYNEVSLVAERYISILNKLLPVK
jgi:5-methylcytosine-specific restriction endonuclease McrA